MIAVTVFADERARRLDLREMTFEQLAEMIEEAPQYPSKAACPWIKLARFGDRRSEGGSLRHDDNVIAITGVEGDYDGEQVSITEAAARLRSAGIKALLYSSPSHRPEAPRWRVLAPLSQPASPDARRALLGRLNGVVRGILSRESFALSQSYYYGRVVGRDYQTERVEGEYLDRIEDLQEIYPANSNNSGGSFDPTPDAELRERFARGSGRHDAMLKLAGRWAARGMRADDIEASLLGLFTDNPTVDPHNGQGIDLRNEAPRIAKGAYQRFYDPRQVNGVSLANKGPEWPAPLDLIELANSEPAPPRHIVEPWLPEGEIALFSGHGGAGKSYVALGFGVCVALGRKWCGLQTAQRRVLFLSFEDGRDVLHWRLARICRHIGVALTDLAQDLRLIDASRVEAEMLIENRDGPILTAAYEWVHEQMREAPAQVLIIDGASDAFGGSEIQRRQVRYFMRALRKLIPQDGAVLLLAHVDKVSAKNGDTSQGYSGSTAWHNSARARWYLRSDDAGLVLELQKSNHSTAGAQLYFRWDPAALLYVADGAASVEGSAARVAREQEERQAILAAMKECAVKHLKVPAAMTGPRTAWHVLRAQPAFPKRLGTDDRATRREFWSFIEGLRTSGAIVESVIRLPHSRPVTILELREGAQ